MSLYRRKDSIHWWCEFHYDKKVVRRSTGVEIVDSTPKTLERSKAKARQKEGEVRKAYVEELREAGSPEKKEITLEAWSKRFLEIMAIEHKDKENTLAFYSDRVKSILRFSSLRLVLLSKIDGQMIDDFKIWKTGSTKRIGMRKTGGKTDTVDTFEPISVTTVNRDLTTLILMLRRARQNGYNVAEVVIKLNRKAEDRRRKARRHVLTAAEERQYLEAAPELLKDFATIAIDTGLRPDSEICALKWENLRS